MTLDLLVCPAFKLGNAVIHAECGDSTHCQDSLGLLYKTFQDSVITKDILKTIIAVIHCQLAALKKDRVITSYGVSCHKAHCNSEKET